MADKAEKENRSVVRNAAYQAGAFSIREKHNERLNVDYANESIDPERAGLNVHLKPRATDTDGKPETYQQTFNRLLSGGVISKHGLKADAKVFDELVFDINTAYFEEHGGYEYAKRFYEEAYRLAIELVGGEKFVLSAVMHADERNDGLSKDLGRDIYHYHLHVVYIPVVRKELYYQKSNKSPELAGKLKEVITQISHSKLMDEFYWNDIEQTSEKLADTEKYKRIVSWAGKGRGQNPNVFDALTEWILDDSEWNEEKLSQNEQILMQGVFARFKEQNANLRAYLKEFESSGVVNDAVFKALDRFDDELSGKTHAGELREVVSKIFADFVAMRDHNVREQIAGGKTGPTGTDSVKVFGFINLLKDCDAGVQWALFMPEVVKNQQKGFKVDSFEYKKMPAMRFIGRECIEHDPTDMSRELDIMRTLDSMQEYKSGLDYDVLFMHHYGKGVDVERWHGFWGRFMKADAPVPEEFIFLTSFRKETVMIRRDLRTFRSSRMPLSLEIWTLCTNARDMTATLCMMSPETSCLVKG